MHVYIDSYASSIYIATFLMHSYVHRVQTGIACLPRPRPGSPAFTPSIPRPRPGPRSAFTPPQLEAILKQKHIIC